MTTRTLSLSGDSRARPRTAQPARLSSGVFFCLLLALVVGGLAHAGPAGLSTGKPPTAAPTRDAATPDRYAASTVDAATPFDLGAVMRSLALAFRPDGNAWTAAGSAYAVRADAQGFEVEPLRRARGDSPATHASPVRFTEALIARGDHTLGASANTALPRVEADGHLVVDRGAIAQHLRNTGKGVELSYSLPARPEGAGDLTVRLAVSGQTYAGESDNGHHYADAGAGLGARVGRATWIDARGARADVPVLAVHGGLELRVPADLVDASVYPAVLDPLISPEGGTDEPVLGIAGDWQMQPAVAFDGTQHLVVWQDGRGEEDALIYGARVAADGTVLDPYGLRIAVGQYPRVAAGEDGFLVLFAERAAQGSLPDTIRAARVSAAGVVLDPGGFDLAMSRSWDFSGSVAFADGNYLAAWTHESDTYLARIALDGTILDPGGVLTIPEGWIAGQALASGGGTTFLTWQLEGAILGSRISPQGTLLDPGGIEIEPFVDAWAGPLVAFDGTSYVVAWLVPDDDTQPPSMNVKARRVTPEGAVLDPVAILVLSRPHLNGGDTLALASNGAGSVVAHSFGGDGGDHAIALTYLARLSPEGAALDATPILLTDQGHSAAFAPTAAGVFTVWTDLSQYPTYGSGSTFISGREVGLDGALQGAAPTPISTSANAQVEPSVAFDGQHYLLVWSDGRSDGAGEPGDIYAARVSPAGELLDPSAFPVATGPNEESEPLAIFNGQSTVVAWVDTPPTDYNEYSPPLLMATRVSPEGAALDVPALKLTMAEGDYVGAALGVDGSVRFVVDTRTVHVSQNGAVSIATAVPELPIYPHPRALTFDGTNHLIVWTSDDQDPKEGYSHDISIVGERIGPDDTLLDPSPLAIATTDGSAIVDVAAGFGADVSLVVWIEDEPGFARLRAVRLAPDGTTLDPRNGLLLAEHATGNTVCVKELTASNPAVVFDGQVFVVAWRVPQDHCEWDSFDLLGATVTPAGEVGPAFVISEAPHAKGPPALASAGNGETLITFARFLEEAPYGATRVRTLRLTTCDPSACLGGNCDACGDGPDDPPAPIDPTNPGALGETRTPVLESCGCSAAGAPTTSAGPVLALLVGLLAAGRLRRRRTVSP